LECKIHYRQLSLFFAVNIYNANALNIYNASAVKIYNTRAVKIYNASAVKIYNATISPVRFGFENKKAYFEEPL
jgi:hypothetical protein